MKEEGLLIQGIVLESYQNATFKVKLENNNQSTALCSISGKIRKFNIRITIGDTVIVELSPYDLTKGRIVKRK